MAREAHVRCSIFRTASVLTDDLRADGGRQETRRLGAAPRLPSTIALAAFAKAHATSRGCRLDLPHS